MPNRPAHHRRPALQLQSYRSAHRAREDRSAHADAAQAPTPDILDHPLVPGDPPHTVETPAALAELIDHCRTQGGFAYDSEFIGEHTFYPKLCVIQVATLKRIALIDPLRGLDLTPLWELLADPAVETIVHAGRQDLEPVVRALGRGPGNVFDTQLAAGFVGLPYPAALEKLVGPLAGADMGQGLKFSQWDRRPLSRVQMLYAANDVRYLPLVRRELGDRLDAAGRADWAREENGTLEDAELYRFDPQGQKLRVRGVDLLGARKRAVLAALVRWRGGAAQQENLPPRTLMPDVSLFEVARQGVTDADQLARIKGLPRPVRQRYAEAILACIDQAMRGPAPPVPRRAAPSQAERDLLDDLWQRVQQIAEDSGVALGLVTSKKDVARLAAAIHRGNWPRDSKLTRGWRAELLAPLLDELRPAG